MSKSIIVLPENRGGATSHGGGSTMLLMSWQWAGRFALSFLRVGAAGGRRTMRKNIGRSKKGWQMWTTGRRRGRNLGRRERRRRDMSGGRNRRYFGLRQATELGHVRACTEGEGISLSFMPNRRQRSSLRGIIICPNHGHNFTNRKKIVELYCEPCIRVFFKLSDPLTWFTFISEGNIKILNEIEEYLYWLSQKPIPYFRDFRESELEVEMNCIFFCIWTLNNPLGTSNTRQWLLTWMGEFAG